MGLFGRLSKQELEDKKFYGWSMKTSHFNPHDIVLQAIDNYVPMVDDGTNQFVLLLPPKEIKKCSGMKVIKNKDSGLHLEIIKDKIYAKDNLSLDYVLKAMKDFMIKGKVPDIKDYYEYEETIDITSYKDLCELLIEDSKSLNDLYKCFDSPKIFYKNNKELYEERGILGENNEEIMWIAFVESLIKNKVAVELDYNEDVENTLFKLNLINNSLIIEKDWFISPNLVDNLKAINKQWKDKKYSISYVDINSDSYVIMILSADKLKKAKSLAKNLNRKISKM